MKSEEISMLVLSKKRFEEGRSGKDGRDDNESESNGIFCQDELAFLDTTSKDQRAITRRTWHWAQ